MAKSKRSTKAEVIRKKYQKCKELNQDAFDKVEINKNLYKGILNVDDNYDWDYSLVDPQVFPLVRNYLSRSNPSMSAIRLDVRHGADIETREVNQQFVNWEVGELMTTTLFYRMFFSAYLAGKGYCKTGWLYQKALEIKEMEDVEVEPDVKRVSGATDLQDEVEEQEVEQKETRRKILRDITNRADAKFIRFNNILIPNRNIPSLHEQPYIIELIDQNVGEMLDENAALEERGESEYWDKKFLKTLKKSGVTDKLLEYEYDKATDSDAEDDWTFRQASVPLICMHTNDGEIYYMPLEKISDGVDSEDGEEDIINVDTTSRYWHGHYPFIEFSPFPEDDEYFNVALVDIVGDLQIASTEVLNQIMTNIRQVNTDMWIAGSAASQTPDWQFRKRPDGVIRVMGDASQIQQIRTQDNTRSAVSVAENLGQKIEKAGGISSLYSSGAGGIGQSINQTARGAQIIDANIDTNMKMIVDLFGEQVLKKLGEHFLELNAQYVTEEQSFSVTGKRGVKELISINPERVCANFIVTVNTDKIQKQTPASRQASLQNTMTILQNVETQSQGDVKVNLTPLVEALVDATPDLDNVENIITSIDEKSEKDIAMIERAQLPEIKIKDAHEDLIVAVNVYFGDIEGLPPEVMKVLEQYVEKHLKHIQAQQELNIMKQPQLPGVPGAGGVQGAIGGGGFNPAGADQQGLPSQGYNLGNIV